MRAAVLLVILAACWSAPIAPTAPKPALAGCTGLTKAPPQTFARLFCEGATWTLDGASVITGPDDSHEHMIEVARKVGSLTCTISSVKELRRGWTSNLECTNTLRIVPHFPEHLVATPAGLWSSFEEGGDPSTMVLKDRILAEPPANGSKDQAFAEGGATQWVSHRENLWCFGDYTGGMGQVGAWTLCVRDGELVGAGVEATSDDDSSQVVRTKWGSVFEMQIGGS